MGNTFNTAKMIESAVQIEKNGRDYYDQAAKFVKAGRAKQVLEYISNEEQQHIAVFENILDKVENESKAGPKFSTEFSDYLLALADENVFTKNKQGSEMSRKIRNDKHALEMAFGFEKDSILFYYEVKKILPANFYSNIDDLIAQEQDHIKKLSDLLKGFNKFGVSGMP